MSMTPPGADPNEPVLPPPPSDTTQPPSAFGAPPPPPAAFGAQPPPGYVQYNQGGGYLGAAPLATTVGLRKWVSGLFILVTALTGLSAWAQFSRVGVIDDFIAGNASIFDIDDADQLTFAAGILELVGTVAAAIVLCVWTLRTIRNAEALCGDGLKPRLAAGGWFIPIGNLWVSFAKLRQAAKPLRAETSNTSRWQGLWIVGVFTSNSSFRSDALSRPTIEGVRDGLSNVAAQGAFATVVLGVATFFAIRAMCDLENAIVARQAQQQ